MYSSLPSWAQNAAHPPLPVNWPGSHGKLSGAAQNVDDDSYQQARPSAQPSCVSGLHSTSLTHSLQTPSAWQ
jgi:hypothetical protein